MLPSLPSHHSHIAGASHDRCMMHHPTQHTYSIQRSLHAIILPCHVSHLPVFSPFPRLNSCNNSAPRSCSVVVVAVACGCMGSRCGVDVGCVWMVCGARVEKERRVMWDRRTGDVCTDDNVSCRVRSSSMSSCVYVMLCVHISCACCLTHIHVSACVCVCWYRVCWLTCTCPSEHHDVARDVKRCGFAAMQQQTTGMCMCMCMCITPLVIPVAHIAHHLMRCTCDAHQGGQHACCVCVRVCSIDVLYVPNCCSRLMARSDVIHVLMIDVR